MLCCARNRPGSSRLRLSVANVVPEKPSADSLPDIETGLSQAEARTLTSAALMHFIRARLQATGCPEPEIESRLIVQRAARMSTARLLASLNDVLPPGASDAAFEMLARRERREPLPYILGEREFYGRTFKVDRRVLIPRPETELLVERAIEFGRERGDIRIADIGTGSGALAVTIALELPDAEVTASDVSTGALDIARSNAIALGAAARVMFADGDLTAP